jgi:hypothetical protein
MKPAPKKGPGRDLLSSSYYKQEGRSALLSRFSCENRCINLTIIKLKILLNKGKIYFYFT